MTTVRINASLPNSMVALMDQNKLGDIPTKLGPNRLAASRSCVVIGTQANMDGDTLITLTDAVATAPPGDPVFDGTLETPTKHLVAFSILLEPVLQLDVPSTAVRLRIWKNHPTHPTLITVIATVDSSQGCT